MSDESAKQAKIELGVFPGAGDVGKEAVKEIIKPVYEDGLRPLVRQVGVALETFGLVSNALLTPLRVVAESIEKIRPRLTDELTARLQGVEPGSIQPPPALVLIPAIEGYVLSEGVSELQEMFLNLVASSMDTGRDQPHPSYVEIIKQISGAEARILRTFFDAHKPILWRARAGIEGRSVGHPYSLIQADAGLDEVLSVAALLTNLTRLAIVAEGGAGGFTASSVADLKRWDETNEAVASYRLTEWIAQNPDIRKYLSAAGTRGPGYAMSFEVKSLHLTEYGRAFCLACVGQGDPRGVDLGESNPQGLY